MANKNKVNNLIIEEDAVLRAASDMENAADMLDLVCEYITENYINNCVAGVARYMRMASDKLNSKAEGAKYAKEGGAE